MKRLAFLVMIGLVGCSGCITVVPCRCPPDDKQDNRGVPLPPPNGSTVQTTAQTRGIR